MPLLTPEDLHALHDAAVGARLVEQRATLVAGIDAAFIATMPVRSSPSEQVRSDLDILSRTGALADGSVPLLTWLANAAHAAGPQVQAAVFARVLAALRASAPAPPPAAAGVILRRDELLDALGRMLPAQFERLLERVGVPVGDIAGPQAPQGMRAVDVLRWADQAGAVDEVARAHAEITARRPRS
jgi:hypothetical protein